MLGVLSNLPKSKMAASLNLKACISLKVGSIAQKCIAEGQKHDSM